MNRTPQGESVPAVRDIRKEMTMIANALRSAANFGRNASGATNGVGTALGNAFANYVQSSVGNMMNDWATQKAGAATRRTVAIGAAEEAATNVAKTMANGVIAGSKWSQKVSNDIVTDMH
ncbi:hypothetical protein GT347_19670 [Xylophilus rhododendri]|uniref:Uncharacterized protein n=1 Tax=Xylophilus rhododendri TaxID=2697032 RepID=A0A857J9V6_9BURK|nr:hypothetical protein [Xylophilus rhododendri]QHJ00004.1 hypothetical protein GT347_19670 [Xylophilus rhododendri]